MKRPPPNYFDEAAKEIARGALEQVTEELSRRSILPLNDEAQFVLGTVLFEVARQSASNTAALSLSGIDVTFAVLASRQPEQQHPPSPL